MYFIQLTQFLNNKIQFLRLLQQKVQLQQITNCRNLMFKYIKSADMLKQIIQHKKQLKQVIYNKNNHKHNQQNNNNQQSNIKNDISISATYSLLSLVTNNYSKFQQFINKIQANTHQNIKNPYLFIVMVGQYINLGKIKGGGKIKKIIMDNIHLLPQIKKQTKINKENVQIRLIHTNVQNIIQKQQILKQNRQKSNNVQHQEDNFQSWTHIFKDEKKFIQNQLIPNVYNLNSQQYTQILRQHPLLLKSHTAVIQSFSSAIPPFLLLHGVQKSTLKHFKVIDACSAPGNKTIQLGQYISNPNFNRKVLAFQKDPRRFNMLNRTIERYNSHKNIKSYNENFLQTNPQHKRFNKVKFVMLDPSCSGSGMLSNYLRDLNQQQSGLNKLSFKDFCIHQFNSLSQQDKNRVQKLHDFQLQLLNHSAKFKPKRISYSTCSIYQRQNQDVVDQFLQKNKEYELKQNKIISRNIGKYSICEGFGRYRYCVRVDPRKRQTDGFFVAIFILRSKYKNNTQNEDKTKQ